MIVTAYRIDSGFSNVADRVTLTPPPSDCTYSTNKYELPEGYTVADAAYEQLVYDPDGNPCELCLNNRRGTAVLAVSVNGAKGLKKVVEYTPDSFRDLRARSGLSQQALADVAGVSISQVQRLESGAAKTENLTLKNALALSDALGIDPRTLLGIKQSDEKKG